MYIPGRLNYTLTKTLKVRIESTILRVDQKIFNTREGLMVQISRSPTNYVHSEHNRIRGSTWKGEVSNDGDVCHAELQADGFVCEYGSSMVQWNAPEAEGSGLRAEESGGLMYIPYDVRGPQERCKERNL